MSETDNINTALTAERNALAANLDAAHEVIAAERGEVLRLREQLATARNDALEEALTVIREELERARKYLPQAAIIVAAVEKDILALKTKEPTDAN